MLKLKKQEIKDLVAVSFKFLKEIASKLEAESKRRHVFFIWFWIVFYPFWLYIKSRGVEGGGRLLDGWKSVMHGKSYVFTVRKILFNFKKKVLGSFNKGKLSENSFNIAQTKNLNWLHHVTLKIWSLQNQHATFSGV